MSLESLKKMKEEYQVKIKSEGEAALKEHFKEFFAENPKILGVCWEQYTPYFNDGEECVFSVNEVRAKVADSKDDDDDYEDGFESTYALNKKGLTKESDSIESLFSVLSEMEDVLQAVLGDHSRIVVTPESVEIEEYEHD